MVVFNRRSVFGSIDEAAEDYHDWSPHGQGSFERAMTQVAMSVLNLSVLSRAAR